MSNTATARKILKVIKQLRMLAGAIDKWREIAYGTGEDKGPSNCACCIAYVNSGKFLCDGCPIQENTGVGGCINTPYEEWNNYFIDLGLKYPEVKNMNRVVIDKTKPLAVAEFKYLTRLSTKLKKDREILMKHVTGDHVYFKVRIKSCCNDSYWYKDCIGDVVIVYVPYEGSWGYEAKKNLNSIFRGDCELIAKSI